LSCWDSRASGRPIADERRTFSRVRLKVAEERNSGRAGRPYPPGSMVRFALAEAALLWMGALVGPMLVATGVAGAIWGVAVGVIVGVGFLILLFLAVMLYRRSQRPQQWSSPRHVRRAGEPARVLIVASEASVDPLLMREIEFRARGADVEVFVVTPVLDRPFEHWVGGSDEERHVAERYLQTLLGQLRGLGVHTEGSVGTNEPLASIEAALQLFPADEIVIATHPLDKQGWLEHGIVRKIRARSDLPITHVVPVGDRDIAGSLADDLSHASDRPSKGDT